MASGRNPTDTALPPAAASAAERIATALRAARRDAGLTQAELGAFVDADRFAVAALEARRLTRQVVRLLELLDAAGLEIDLVPRSTRLASAPESTDADSGRSSSHSGTDRGRSHNTSGQQ